LTKPPIARRVITWQRQWGGGRQKHGEERYYANERCLELQTYRDGRLHGPFQQFMTKSGRISTAGQYASGRRAGIWKEFDHQGNETAQHEYRGGTLWRATITRTYDVNSPPTAIRSASPSTARKLTIGWRGSPWTGRSTMNESRSSSPGRRAWIALKCRSKMSRCICQIFVLDDSRVDVNLPITETWIEVPLSAALTATTELRGLACDYRYGCVWITSAEDVEDWHDPTGVAQIVPPPGSQLARSWNEPVVVDTPAQPLADVLDGLVGRLAIAIDTSPLAPAADGDEPQLETTHFRPLPLKHALGILLYQTHCRCRLDGETLVILPPE
jgi:hypothetical protein